MPQLVEQNLSAGEEKKYCNGYVFHSRALTEQGKRLYRRYSRPQVTKKGGGGGKGLLFHFILYKIAAFTENFNDDRGC